MQKKRIVQKVLSKRFAERGFEFLGSVDRGVWEFKRVRDDGIEQSVCIHLVRYDSSSMGLNIYSKYGQASAGFFEDTPKEESFSKRWEFSNESEFTEALEEMWVLLERAGFRKLEELSISPYKYEPTDEMCSFLYENHKELCEQFMSKHNLSESITFAESVEVTKKIIENESDYSSEEDEKAELIKLSAFLGEQLVKRYDGNWKYISSGRKGCCVELKHLISSAYTLNWILLSAKTKDSKSIENHYKGFIENDHMGYFHKGKWVQRG